MSYAKFWAALLMAGVTFLRSYTGTDLGLDETTINTLVAAITAAAVWAVPNKPKDQPFYGRSGG